MLPGVRLAAGVAILSPIAGARPARTMAIIDDLFPTGDTITHLRDGLGAVLPEIANFRDLGGHLAAEGLRVRTGLVYRSTILTGLAPVAMERLTGLGVRTVYDLRTDDERARQPEADGLPGQMDYVVADVAGSAGVESPMWFLARLDEPHVVRQALGEGRAEAMFATKFRSFVTSDSAHTAFHTLFTGLSDGSRLPAVFHCATGKDRTGWAAAALLTLLGVPAGAGERDFLASNVALVPLMAPLVERYVAAGGDATDLAPLVGVLSPYLQAGLDEVDRSYGSMAGYFADGLGIDRAAQDRLRTLLLEPA